MYVVVMIYIWIGRSWIFLYNLEIEVLHVFIFFLWWGPFVHSLGIVQWNSTSWDHPGNPGGVSGSGLVSLVSEI